MDLFSRDDLIHLEKRHDHFVGIDSDGCVFDTMGVKQKNHFHPLIVRTWGLEAIEPQLRAAAEFVNLYSRWRGANRFPALLKVFRLLKEWPEAAEAGVTLPDTRALEDYLASGRPLDQSSLREAVAESGDPELARLLEWNRAVNRDIAENMEDIPPFPGVRACLEKMGKTADMIVVSQTPEEALVKEWNLHGLAGFVRVIAGQELGTKAEHLKLARGNRYDGSRMLMIGDAPGDRKAAEEAGACFFPILPGDEAASWRELIDEGFDRFIEGSFVGRYQKKRIEDFEALLPDTPPWISS